MSDRTVPAEGKDIYILYIKRPILNTTQSTRPGEALTLTLIRLVVLMRFCSEH